MKVHLLTFLFVLLLLTLAACQIEGTRPKMRIGYMNCNSEPETLKRFGALNAYLSRETGIDFELVPVDTQDFVERFAAGEFEFTHTNSLLYLILRKEQQLRLLATEKRGRYGSSTSSSIIVRRDSPIKSIDDLRGKRMIFGPQLAPSGFLTSYDLLLSRGFDPEKELSYYAIPAGSFKHEKVIYAVYFGEFDAGAAPSLDLELMIGDGKISADDFRVLAESPIVPYCTFGARDSVDPALAEKFRQALVTLTPETLVEFNGEKIKVMASAWVDGYETLADSDYDGLRAMAKRANMPPYQVY